MLTGALSERKSDFGRWLPRVFVGGDAEEGGEIVGEGQYSSKPVFLWWAADISGGWGGKLIGGRRREAGLETEARDSECVGEGEKETEGGEAL